MSNVSIQVTVVCTDERKDVISAELDQLGYDGVWDDGDRLHTYIPMNRFNEKELYRMLSMYNMENSYYRQEVKERNWNEEWEASYKPFYLDKELVIRASFHSPEKEFPYEIIIDPRMSFGTGHHETTELMLRAMLDMDFKGKRVLDMGSGTGVLSILADKMGATRVLAVDNDINSVENARDNLRYNAIANVECIHGGAENIQGEFDIALSNITRNVNVSLLPMFASHVVANGQVVISGFLDFDRDEMIEAASAAGLAEEKSLEKNNWQCLKLRKR